MIKYIKKIFLNLLVLKCYVIFNKNKFSNDNYEYNFSNIEFIDEVVNKKNLLNNLYSKDSNYYLKDFNYHCFNWLVVSKKIGGGININKAKNYLFNWNKSKFKKNSFVWKDVFISNS